MDDRAGRPDHGTMTDNDEMTGRIALVTGANKGIGREIAGQLAQRGMTVLLGARDKQRREDAVASLRADGMDVRPVALDVTDVASAAEAAAQIDREYGRLDVLVNNAGISGGRARPSQVDLGRLRMVFETNVFGIVIVTNAMLPLLRRSHAAVIVNVSSEVGSLAEASDPESALAGMPPSGVYVPSKTAVNSLTVQYAKDLRADNILVNAINPGFCATDLNDHQGFLDAAQGAAVAVRYATIGADGPTGGFFGASGPVRW
jgi:NAD(P)-dependent dehydrogenase (short-subunit alcohol dehydrogenase family)